MPSIVDLAPAADWDEREAADLYGIRFDGHEPLRPLVDHDLDLARWTVRVRGDDPYQVAVGPIHAGVIESGHFRFHVVGDRILHLDARLFYKHRGLERAAEGKTLDEGLAFAARACAACAVTNGVAYAHACEEALGLAPTAELARARTILLELERMWSHLNDIAAVCAGVGLAAGNNQFAALTERARRLNATLTGHRFLFGSVRVGGSDLATRPRRRRAPRARRSPRSAPSRPAAGASSSSTPPSRTGSRTSASSPRRTPNGSAPSARPRARRDSPRTPASGSRRLSYDDLEPIVPRRAAGDVRARFEQRALELLQTFDLLERLLDGPVCAGGRDAASAGAADRHRPRRKPARRDELHRGAKRQPHRASPPTHRLVRELARRRPRRRRQPPPRLPSHQQELRALLRLRRPLMLTLLRDLRRLRRDIALPRARRADAASRSATSTPARATAASTS